MLALPTLKPGDSVDVIAPASRCSDQQLKLIKELLESWQLKCLIPEDIFGKDLFCANTDEVRLAHLTNALTNTQTKAIICARGGYGSLRLIPALSKLTPPATSKIFVGMSDITALHLFLQQQWQWSTIHGASAPDRFSPESIASLKSLLFGETQQVQFAGNSLNESAKRNNTIISSIAGGNLSIIQASMGTSWQLNGRNKIILLEDTGERGYRVDRMLEHLEQADIFKDAAAILLGDFTGGLEPDGTSLIKDAIHRFAERCTIPLVQVEGIGHASTNFSIPLGTPATLQLGSKMNLTCFRT